MENSIYHSELLCNCFKKLSLCKVFPQTTMKHIMAILISVFSLGYHGKTIDFEKYSPCHRTTVAHFLNKGTWDDPGLEDIIKNTVIQFISLIRRMRSILPKPCELWQLRFYVQFSEFAHL